MNIIEFCSVLFYLVGAQGHPGKIGPAGPAGSVGPKGKKGSLDPPGKIK